MELVKTVDCLVKFDLKENFSGHGTNGGLNNICMVNLKKGSEYFLLPLVIGELETNQKFNLSVLPTAYAIGVVNISMSPYLAYKIGGGNSS